MELAFRAEAHSIFVRTGYGLGDWIWHHRNGHRQPECVVEDLTAAVDWILGQKQ